MQRLAAGERAALGVLVERHQAAVYRYARSLTDPAAAEDALQQCFLDALRGAGTWSGRASVRSWLFTLARNAVYRGARRRAGEPPAFVPLHELGAAAGWGEDPEQAAERALGREVLAAALERLHPEHREIIVLRELEQLSGPEVARLLGISLAAQKSRLHRARLQLAAHLRQEVSRGT